MDDAGEAIRHALDSMDQSLRPEVSVGYSLSMKRARGEDRRFQLTHRRTRIGRDHRCELQVLLPGISRYHCEIQVQADGLRLRDLDSESGTFWNDREVRETTLRHGDRIAIGPVIFTVCRDAPGADVVAARGSAQAAARRASS